MTLRFPSGTNVFLPEATGMAVAFVRDPQRFKVNQYIQLVKAEKPVVYYAYLDPDEPVRVVNDNVFDWPDGQPRPRPYDNWAAFRWAQVRTMRRNYGYTLGEQIVEAASGWNPRAFFNAVVLSKAMTFVTKRVISMLETASNWGNNTATVAVLTGTGGATWANTSNDPANANYLNIKKSLTEAVRRISLATNGVVQWNDLVLVISPGLALRIANTPEIHDYVKSSPFALQQIRGDEPNQNQQWGLPATLYGLKLVVEDAVITTQKRASTMADATKTFVKSDSSAIICSRIGGLDGNYGSPSFSTVQRYFYKYEMSVETFYEAKDKLYEVHVVDQFREVLVAPQAGFLITNTI